MIPKKNVQTGNAKVDACAYVLPWCLTHVECYYYFAGSLLCQLNHILALADQRARAS